MFMLRDMSLNHMSIEDKRRVKLQHSDTHVCIVLLVMDQAEVRLSKLLISSILTDWKSGCMNMIILGDFPSTSNL